MRLGVNRAVDGVSGNQRGHRAPSRRWPRGGAWTPPAPPGKQRVRASIVRGRHRGCHCGCCLPAPGRPRAPGPPGLPCGAPGEARRAPRPSGRPVGTLATTGASGPATPSQGCGHTARCAPVFPPGRGEGRGVSPDPFPPLRPCPEVARGNGHPARGLRALCPGGPHRSPAGRPPARHLAPGVPFARPPRVPAGTREPGPPRVRGVAASSPTRGPPG